MRFGKEAKDLYGIQSDNQAHDITGGAMSKIVKTWIVAAYLSIWKLSATRASEPTAYPVNG